MENKLSLQKEILELHKEQFSLRMLHASKELKQTHKIKIVRRKIAVLETKLRQLSL